MFYGEYNYKVDEKGRVAIPPRFRRELKDGVVLSPGAEKCINMYPLSEWRKLATSLTSSPLTPNKMRRLKRAIFSTAFNVAIDGQNRVALPIPLREHAEIQEDVVVTGANNYLEIWNQVLWEEEKAISQEQAWQIIESLERRDEPK
jgi:MraZ protein